MLVTTLRWGTTAIIFDATDLQLLHLLLQISNVFAAVADIRIHPLLHERVIGGLPHVGRSGNQGLFPLDLAVDREALVTDEAPPISGAPRVQGLHV